MKLILINIFQSDIKDFLGFKGGTLAYLLHNLDRFSTDVDIDVLDLDKEQIIIERIKEILWKIGDIKNETLGKNLHRWIFRYDESSMNIKVELNKRYNPHNRYEIKRIDDVEISCMTVDCMFANKILALSERFYNRDLYDVYFFGKNNFPVDFEIIKERSGLDMQSFLSKLISEIPKHFSSSTLLAGLGEVLTENQKSRVKNHLIDEAILQLKILEDGMRKL